MYINDNLAVDLHLETWRWSKLQTSEKSMCFVFSELPEIISFFFLSLLSLFEKKFFIWSMRKPRVINIILSSSVKFTVNQVLWMWAYAMPLCYECFTLSCIFVSSSSNCHSLSHSSVCFSDFPVIISTKNIAIFGAWNVLQSSNLFFFFCIHFLIVTPT